MTTLELTLGRNGHYHVASGDGATDLSAVLDNKFVVCVVQEDTVFTALTDDAAVNMVTESNMGSKTYTAGAVISPRANKRFKSVTLSSGSVIFYQA